MRCGFLARRIHGRLRRCCRGSDSWTGRTGAIRYGGSRGVGALFQGGLRDKHHGHHAHAHHASHLHLLLHRGHVVQTHTRHPRCRYGHARGAGEHAAGRRTHRVNGIGNARSCRGHACNWSSNHGAAWAHASHHDVSCAHAARHCTHETRCRGVGVTWHATAGLRRAHWSHTHDAHTTWKHLRSAGSLKPSNHAPPTRTSRPASGQAPEVGLRSRKGQPRFGAMLRRRGCKP
mmetsp:Transcript_99817/g.281808  ORF Transcript_99817/g.281808 Transcript_99817/m.281808 type:complete len:232 (-) Transcript_99817:111-806(-)